MQAMGTCMMIIENAGGRTDGFLEDLLSLAELVRRDLIPAPAMDVLTRILQAAVRGDWDAAMQEHRQMIKKSAQLCPNQELTNILAALKQLLTHCRKQHRG